jgi:hypothetical protein
MEMSRETYVIRGREVTARNKFTSWHWRYGARENHGRPAGSWQNVFVLGGALPAVRGGFLMDLSKRPIVGHPVLHLFLNRGDELCAGSQATLE